MPESDARRVAGGAILPTEWMDRDDTGLNQSLGNDRRGVDLAQLRCRLVLLSGGSGGGRGGGRAAAAASTASLVTAAVTECRRGRR